MWEGQKNVSFCPGHASISYIVDKRFIHLPNTYFALSFNLLRLLKDVYSESCYVLQ